MARAVVKHSEMENEMLEFAIQQMQEALEKFTSEKEIAAFLKAKFEEMYQPTWHCFIGRHFASYVTHEKGCYCYFYVGQMGVTLFKTP
mmetsp:Transcript_25766/g.59581  ORF Transcript_25766/g.59581 Transcript_25766/m.59581 type:complete len:88 (-) Transcript_25766:105-368(-)